MFQRGSEELVSHFSDGLYVMSNTGQNKICLLFFVCLFVFFTVLLGPREPNPDPGTGFQTV